MNKQNLLKLADFLENNVTQEMFNMDSYRMHENGACTQFYSKTECGTVGCALGWSPLIEGLEFTDAEYNVNSKDYSFYNYCDRVFNLDDNSNYRSPQWDFLFSAEWTKFDNTPKGAANRIKFLVSEGVPSDFENELLEGARYDDGSCKHANALEEINNIIAEYTP